MDFFAIDVNPKRLPVRKIYAPHSDYDPSALRGTQKKKKIIQRCAHTIRTVYALGLSAVCTLCSTIVINRVGRRFRLVYTRYGAGHIFKLKLTHFIYFWMYRASVECEYSLLHAPSPRQCRPSNENRHAQITARGL